MRWNERHISLIANLNESYIPMIGYIQYRTTIKPPKLINGRPRTPDEIIAGTKDYYHTYYMDKLGNVYLIPSTLQAGSYVDAYSPMDIVKAIYGDQVAIQKIENAHDALKKDFDRDLMYPSFAQRLYEKENPTILADMNDNNVEEGAPNITLAVINNNRAAVGLEPVADILPATYTSLAGLSVSVPNLQGILKSILPINPQ